MNWKKIILGFGAILMCMSLIAYGGEPPKTTASAADVNATSPHDMTPTTEAMAPTLEAVEQAIRKTPAIQEIQSGKAAILSGVSKKNANPLALDGSRGTPVNDDCEDAIVVTSPYPVTVCGTNVNATVDCPDVFNWNAVWYEIELPYAVNNLVTDYCPTEENLAPYQVGTLFLNDCSDCNSMVYGSYEWHSCGDGDSNPEIRWYNLAGPTTVFLPVFINPAHEFCIEIEVTEVTQPDNDNCEDAELVTGPYPVTVCGTNQGATLDCPGVMDWNAVWYEVVLPYEVNTVETDYCPGEINMQNDEVGIVYSTECCGEAVVGNYEWRDCGGFRRNPSIWWRDVPGPGTILIPVYINPAHDFCIEFNVRDGNCAVPCPPEGVPENEACGEDTNGGCNMSMPAFEPLTCGETVCGTGWADMGRDTDWYEITVEEPVTMTFTVTAEFITGVSVGLMETYTPGVVGCDQITGLIDPWETGVDCEEVTVVYDALPGTYWWFVGPNGWMDMPCGVSSNYVATMTCEPWEVRGACCDDATADCVDNVLLTDCPAPMRFAKDKLCDEMSPPCGGCPGSMIEIQIVTDRYPTETTWTITDHNDPNIVLCSGGPYERSYWTYFEYCCVDTDGCVDFTIYDLAGDGQSWFAGGYAVRFDGIEVCSTLETSWTGFEQSCNNLGYGCDPGRCCYSPWPNCTDTTMLDCINVYGGLWSEGKSCAADPCQDPDAPDFAVVAPYSSPQISTCNGALDRCHPVNQYADTPEHVYLVTIPYDGVWSFNTCLTNSTDPTWLSVGTSMCGEDIGWNAWACNGYFSEVVALLTAGDYYVDVEGNQQCCEYVLDIHEIAVCDVGCPADSTPESEPCGENTNNGCWGWPNAFEPIAENQTICGQIYADNGFDTDWFEYVATANDTMTFSVRTNFDGKIGVAQQGAPGQPGCDNFTGMIEPYADTSDCVQQSVSFLVTAGGTYYLFVGHQFSYGSPCGTTNDYVATLTGGSGPCPDLNGDGVVNLADLATLLGNYGRPNPTFEQGDLDGDGDVDLSDLASLLSVYGTTCP